MRTVLLTGAALGALVFSAAAMAETAATHVMTLRVPGGGLAEIRYTGDVPPRVVFTQGPPAAEVLAPMPSLFGPASPFAAMERISAEMDREAAAMVRQATAMAAEARTGQLTETAIRNLPLGAQGYSFVSTLSGNGVCTQSVEITSRGDGAPPRVVSHSSGNCGPGAVGTPGTAGASGLPAAPAPVNRPDMVWTAAHGAKPYTGLVREIPPAQR